MKGKEISEEVGREIIVIEREEEIIPDKSDIKMEHFENVEDEAADKEPDVIKYFASEENTVEDKNKENTEEDKHEENTDAEICEEDAGADKCGENTETEMHEENTDVGKYEENMEVDKYEENTGADKCEENTEADKYEENVVAEKYEENLEENTEVDKYEERVEAVEKEVAENKTSDINNDLGEEAKEMPSDNDKEAKEMPSNNENVGEMEEKSSPAGLKERREGRGKKKCGICAGCTNLEDCDSCRYFLSFGSFDLKYRVL